MRELLPYHEDMNIHLTPHAQAVLERHLAVNRNSSAEELVEYALDLLDVPAPTMESLRAKIQVGLDDITAGRVAPLDVESTIRRGRERLVVQQGN